MVWAFSLRRGSSGGETSLSRALQGVEVNLQLVILFLLALSFLSFPCFRVLLALCLHHGPQAEPWVFLLDGTNGSL